MRFSRFRDLFSSESGILQLMADLGEAAGSEQEFDMLGGGNPAQIPAVQQRFRHSMQTMLDNGDEFERMIGNYDGPQGKTLFIEALVKLFRLTYGWDINPENIAITNGSQASFFVLFNLFSGEFSDSTSKKILLPLTPEYIGYADTGLSKPTFKSTRPQIEFIDDRTFKYHIDFGHITIDETIGAICVSRPTNPTGNVITDAEMAKLVELSERHAIPLIVDCAYGAPFPGILFAEAQAFWNPNTIICMSLSKLGLPGVRTGIVIAPKAVIDTMAAANAILNLATGSFGPALALDLVKSGEILDLSSNVIRPWYQQRATHTIAHLNHELKGLPYAVHSAEGAMFLWLWFRDLPISAQELYERLKQKGVLVIPGHHFFIGLNEQWRHKHECIRITYSQNEENVKHGLSVLGEEIRSIYTDNTHAD